MNFFKSSIRSTLMNTSIFIIWISLFILFTTCARVNAAIIMDQDELESYKWIVVQYGQNILPLDETICNGSFSQQVACMTDASGVTHFSSIQIQSTSYVSVGTLNTTLTQFTFPQIIYMVIDNALFSVRDNTTNILSLIKNIPNLNHITVEADNSLVSTPIDFPNNLPKLTKLYLNNNPNFVSIPNFFNNSLLLDTISITNPNLGYINMPSGLNLPSFKYAEINFKPNSSQSLDFSFPKLETVYFDKFGIESLYVNFNSSELYSLTISSEDVIDLNIGNYDKLFRLSLSGSKVTFSPSDFSQFYELADLKTVNVPLTTYPFTQFPPNIKFLQLYTPLFQSFPTIPLPSTLQQLVLSSSPMVGSMPYSIFSNIKPNFILQISGNNQLQLGDVPESFCQYSRLEALSDPYTSFPDCFYCYYLEDNLKLPFSTRPPSFVCNVTIEDVVYPSIYGRIVLRGNNLGWGKVNQGAVIIPNKEVTLPVPNIVMGPPRQESILLSTKMNLSVMANVIDVGISTRPYSQVKTRLSGQSNLLIIYFNMLNTYLEHNITLPIQGVNHTCTIVNQTYDSISCLAPKATPISPYLFGFTDNIYLSTQIFTLVNSTPIVNAANYSYDTRILELHGQFGYNNLSLAVVTVGNTIDCQITNITSDTIFCILDSQPPAGPTTIYANVDDSEFISSTLLFIEPPNNNNNGSTTTTGATTATTTTTTTTGGNNGGETPKEICERLTFNCYGHGVCDDNGICQCFENYYPLDNCLTKFINTTIKPNETNPTVSFDIDGIDFYFEIYSIQELNYDGTILKELNLLNQTWLVTIQSDNITTFATYTLNNTDYSNYLYLNVASNISFSSLARSVQFGSQELKLAPNAIKVGFSINNWPFSSNLATLRVVFKSTINIDQSIEYDCEEKSIDSFTNDTLSSSIEYLRVIKDNIQFNGRFIDFVLSDGRSTYSKTELISLTPTNNPNNTGESIALIGINLPQCSKCQLDPDFTPLIIDKANDGGCENSSSSWRIIVGAVVGGVAAVGIATGTALYIKKKNLIKKSDKMIQAKLNRMSQTS